VTASTYPVRVDATLDDHLSRWRWLVKWFLAIPHYIVLAFLWVAFVVLSCYAFVAILVTGRYPRAVFDFNVGVLRWSWRVSYYAVGAFATDRYPPFTLGDVPDYPAHLEIAYPQRLSRGLVLVKWWLLALPHYLVVALFVGGGGWLAWRPEHAGSRGAGLITLLAVIAAVTLLFTGRYPRPIYDFVVGLNRWVLRVAAYAALMTDAYPPFRLDPGEHDPAATLVIARPSPSGASVTLEKGAVPPTETRRGGWTAPRIVAVVAGAVLALCSLGAFAGGGVAVWFDTHRDGGYVTSSIESRHSSGYAITSDRVILGKAAFDWRWERDLLGKVRIRAASESGRALFAGIAPTDAVNRYLSGVPHTVLREFDGTDTTIVGGATRPAPPTATSIWVAQVSGPGRQVLKWTPRSGDWSVVVMNADGRADVSVTGDIGATVPALPWIATGLFIFAGVTLVAALLLLIIPIRRASTVTRAGPRAGMNA
jgi:hypothetical protein